MNFLLKINKKNKVNNYLYRNMKIKKNHNEMNKKNRNNKKKNNNKLKIIIKKINIKIKKYLI